MKHQTGQNIKFKSPIGGDKVGQIKAINGETYTVAVATDGAITDEIVEISELAIQETVDARLPESLKVKVALFKKGIGEAPKFIADVEVKMMDDKPMVKLTKEIRDRDGEIISVDGMNIDNYLKNPVLIDSHNAWGSVVANVLGRIDNTRKTVDSDGYKVIEGQMVFAPTPNGQIAEALVKGGFVKTVSIGFGVYDYDMENDIATVSELYETSLVSVPANVGAEINAKGLSNENEVMKALLNYKDIHPKIKQYREFFLSDELAGKLGYTKSGDELIDIKGIYDLILSKLENPVPQKQAQQTVATTTKAITKQELSALIINSLNNNPI